MSLHNRHRRAVAQNNQAQYYRQAIQLAPKNARLYGGLGNTLTGKSLVRFLQGAIALVCSFYRLCDRFIIG